MTGSLSFALEHYLLLALFTAAALGWGRLAEAGLTGGMRLPADILIPLRLAAGMGVLMIALFLAGSLHGLGKPVTGLLVLGGAFLAVAAWFRSRRHGTGPHHPGLRWPAHATPWAIVLTTVALPLLVKPLQPPVDWDELAYHLPQARFWAEQGGLAVNEWLRYPLLPFNMHLLYAAAMPFGDEALAHLLHAWTAAVTAVLTFGLARRYFDAQVASLATVMLLLATRWGWSTANVDFGVMLFWTGAFGALALRHESGNPRITWLAAVLAGSAIGVKYQALLFLPVFVALAVVIERRLAALGRGALLLAATGGYWYWRNFLVSGDPLHPLAGDWLGHWLWNATDLEGLHWDLRRVRGWPEWFLLFAAGAPLWWRSASLVQRSAILTGGASVVIWWGVSGYPRYLMGLYPLLAVVSACTVIEVLRRSGAASRLGGWFTQPRARAAGLAALLAAGTAATASDLSRNWRRVLPPGEPRSVFLAQQFGGFELLRSAVDLPPGVLYQLGFEGELYHLRRPVLGDWFGPGRYADVMALTGDAPALVRHLDSLGVDGLLVNREREPFASVTWDPAMADYFERVGSSARATLWWRRP